MKKIELMKVRSYHNVNWSKESYSAQDVLIKHVNYPQYVFEGDFVSSVYNDRESKKWDESRELVGLNKSPDGWANVSDEQILNFAKALYSDDTLEGCQVIRHTNVSNGYPLWRLDVFRSENKDVEYILFPNYDHESETIFYY